MRQGSNKPCPGCNKVKPCRSAKDVCKDCQFLLAYATEVKERIASLSDDEVVVSFGDVWFANEYIYTRAGDIDYHPGDSLRRLFWYVASFGSYPANVFNAEFELLGRDDGVSRRAYAVMSRPLAEAVRDLYAAVQVALKAEYEQGKCDGSNLLMSLARGDLSMNDFDETIKTAER